MKALKYLPDVVTLELIEEKCTGCGICVTVCPHAVFSIEGNVVRIIDRDACMECGACEKNCQFGALTVNSGVGCAAGVLNGLLKGTEPDCGCSGSNSCCG